MMVKQLILTPSSPLLAGTEYTATITTGVKNLQGTPLANDFSWKFTTGTILAPEVTATDPADNATGVALNKIVTANFSMPMDNATINNTSFTLKNGTISVNGVTFLFRHNTYFCSR